MLTISAVFLASSDPSKATTIFGAFPSCFGSASEIWSERPSPLRTKTALCPVDSLNITCTFSSSFIPFIYSANSSVPALILPARLSVIIPSSLTVEKLHLNAMSPGRTSIPTPAASNGPLPV